MKSARIIGVASGHESAWLEATLGKTDAFIRAMLEPSDKNLKEISKLYADAVVAYALHPDQDMFSFLQKLTAGHQRLVVILLCDTSDPTVYSRAMNAGVNTVLSKDISPEDLARTVTDETARLRQKLGINESAAESSVIAVFSTKGGTGKTTVSVNMAVSLAQTGKKVCLIDLDLQFGDVGVFLNIPKAETISDLLDSGDLSPDAVDSFLYKHSSGVRVLCAPNSPEEADAIHPEHLEQIIAAIRAKYDYTILDLPPILDDNSIASIEQADYIWFITNPEISTLKNSKVCMSILGNLNLEKKIRIVLNKDSESSIKQDNVRTVLGTEIELAIPYDYDTAVTAVNRGKPFVLSAPRAKCSKAFEKYVKTHEEIS